jgi:FAD/FMN-containing dehydrogenase
MAAVDDSALAELKRSLEGEAILPGDPGYDEACKGYNSMTDRRPGVIARCASSGDVAAAIHLARESGLPVAVRCGGHSVAGLSTCDDGILIDLGGMKSIEVDPDAKLVRAGGGVLAGELDRATQEHGLVTPTGRVTTTGVGGFTLGGGYAWISNKWGLACDNLVSAEVVTADGQIVTASKDENDDLLWGLRGAGGNFGVVTSYEFKLFELGPTVLGGLALWPMSKATEVLRAWRDYVADAPDELSTACVVLTAPPEEFVPEHLQGQPCLGMAGCYIGDPEEGSSVIQPLKDLGPEVDLIEPMPYTDFQAILDDANPPGLRNYWKGVYMTEVSDEAIDTYVEHASPPLAPMSAMVIFQLGGAVERVGDDETAFSHRDIRYLFHPISAWEDPAEDERQIAFTRDFAAAMEPFTADSLYLNFTAERGEDAVRAGFGDAKYERLVALKDKYDPENLFQLNQNIKPSKGAGAPAAA